MWPVAGQLDNRGVPFVFVTGHFENEGLPAEWRERPLLVKPTRAQAIIDIVGNLFNGRA